MLPPRGQTSHVQVALAAIFHDSRIYGLWPVHVRHAEHMHACHQLVR